MKCPHCGQIHSDNLIDCPTTGRKIKKACSNFNCSYYGEYLFPLEQETCICCGSNLPHELNGSMRAIRDRMKEIAANLAQSSSQTTSQHGQGAEDDNHREKITFTIDNNTAQLFRQLLGNVTSKSSIELQPFKDASTGKYGYSRLFDIVIPAKYDLALPFSENGTAKVIVDGRIYHIDKKGDILSNSSQRNSSDTNCYHLPDGCSSSDLALTYDRTISKYGYSYQGKLIIPAIYQYANPFHNGIVWVKKDGKNLYLKEVGNYIIEEKFGINSTQ